MGLVKRTAYRGGISYSVYYVQFNVREEDGKTYLDGRGKRKRWQVGRDKRQARAQEAIIRTKLLQGWEQTPDPEPVTTLREYVQLWKSAAKRNLAVRTMAGYEQALDLYILPAIGDRDIKSLTWADVKSLIVEKQRDGYLFKKNGQEKAIRRPYSANTLRLIRATLSTVLSDAADEGIIPTNPLIGQRHRRRGIKTPTVEVSVLSWEQKQLFEEKIAELRHRNCSHSPMPQCFCLCCILRPATWRGTGAKTKGY